MGKCKRYNRETRKYVEVNQPAMVDFYNKNMGVVDNLDLRINNYSITIRNRKLYWCLARMVWCCQMVWYFFKNHQERSNGALKNMSLLDFTREVVQVMLKTYGKESIPSYSLSTLGDKARETILKDRGFHNIVFTGTNGVYKHCKDQNFVMKGVKLLY